LIGGEQELRDERNAEAVEALHLINYDLNSQTAFYDENLLRAQRQRDVAEASCTALGSLTSESKTRAHDLLLQIETARSKT